MDHVISVLAEDKPGVLLRITGAVSARGDNIVRLTATGDARPGLARITFTVNTNPGELHLLNRRLMRLVNVLEVQTEAFDPIYGLQMPLSLERTNATT